MTEKWAQTSWTIGDIKALRPEWTDEECAEWLDANEEDIMDTVIASGWEIIEMLL